MPNKGIKFYQEITSKLSQEIWKRVKKKSIKVKWTIIKNVLRNEIQW